MAAFVVIGNEQIFLAQALATSLDAQYHPFKMEHFADTEVIFSGLDYHCISKRIVVLVFQFPSMSYHKNLFGLNAHLFDFLLLVQTIQAMKPKKILVLMPYLPYSRQEKEHLAGVAPTISLVGQIFKSVGIDLLITSDIHSSLIQGLMLLPLHVVGLENFWVNVVREHVIARYQNCDVCIASPDRGAVGRVEKIAKGLKLELVAMTKQRLSHDRSRALSLDGDVKNKVVVIVDDIIDTSGTAVNACNLALERGAAHVIGCFSHVIL